MLNLLYFFRALLSDFLIYASMFFIGLWGVFVIFLFKYEAHYVVRIFCKCSFFILRYIAKIKVEFKGEVPSGNILICSKHQSFLDILMLLYILPDSRFIMKKELVNMPILGYYARLIGCIPVNREKKGEALKELIISIKKFSSGQIVIYPQGTRVKPGEDKPYKIGAGVLCTKLKMECYLVATNAGVFWGRKSFFRYPGKAVISFLGKVKEKENIDEFMKEIETRIEDESNKLLTISKN